MKSRLRLIRKELNLTQEALAGKLGIGKSALSMIETGKAALSERNKNILVHELSVNPDWLSTGNGNMFSVLPDNATVSAVNKDTLLIQRVPLYNLDTTGGLVPLFRDSTAYAPLGYIHIPNLPRCDGAIYVLGDSMYPLLKGGDIILYKRLNDIGDIFWGDMYLLSVDMDGEEYITVKYIQKSEKEGMVKLVSYNIQHAEKDIEISKIRALAFVKASIRMNSIV